jgi:hypothetical protein
MVVSLTKAGAGEYLAVFDLGRFTQEGRRMIVTGSFVGWQTEPETMGPRNGFVSIYRKENTAEILLPPGRYEYKYYDLAENEWMEIDRYPEIYRGYFWDYVWNEFGTLNCQLTVPE